MRSHIPIDLKTFNRSWKFVVRDIINKDNMIYHGIKTTCSLG